VGPSPSSARSDYTLKQGTSLVPMPPADNTPRSRVSAPVRIIGLAVLAILILAVILLALGVFNFEPQGWFKS
jgi:hypothetical protein